MIILTYEHLEELKTAQGGYTNATIKALGKSVKKGWLRSLIGKAITEEQYKLALEGREKRAFPVKDEMKIEKIVINGKWYELKEL